MRIKLTAKFNDGVRDYGEFDMTDLYETPLIRTYDKLTVVVPHELRNIVPDLQRFFDAMVYKLRRNAHKGRWEDMDLNDALPRLREEVDELQEAIAAGSTMEITMEAADVANFALIVANIALESKK